MHNPDYYANPLEFNPDRFLGNHPEPDPRATVFGFGRRVCEYLCFAVIPSPLGRFMFLEGVFLSNQFSKRLKQLIYFFFSFLCSGPGLNLAQSSLWLSCAMSLAVFDIEKYVDEFGNVVEPKIHYSDGTIR